MATFKWDCPHPQCRARQAAFRANPYHFSPADDRTYVVGICPICDRPTFFLVQAVPSGRSAGPVFNGYEGDPFVPHAATHRKNHGIEAIGITGTIPAPAAIRVPSDTPANVTAALEEGLKAWDASLLPSAVYNLRKALERAVRDLDPSGNGGLKARIKKLSDDGRIPSTLVNLAHTVRAEGNTEVHEDEAWTPEQVEELVEFARLLLTYVYTLPRQIEAIATKRGATADKR